MVKQLNGRVKQQFPQLMVKLYTLYDPGKSNGHERQIDVQLS